jgi:telomere length regulation protein
MKPLEEFAFKDDHGKDQGINVRQKAKEVISFLQDDEKIREERRKAKKTRDKYVGVSSNEFRSYS